MECVLARAARLLDENMETGDLEHLYAELDEGGIDEFMLRLADKLKVRSPEFFATPDTQRNV